LNRSNLTATAFMAEVFAEKYFIAAVCQKTNSLR
jgi:hypothetical protein